MNHENGLFWQSKAWEDAEARIKNLLLFFSSSPVSGGQCGPVLSEPSLLLELAENSRGKKGCNDRNKYLSPWIIVFKISLNFFQPPEQTFTNGPNVKTLKKNTAKNADFVLLYCIVFGYRDVTEKLSSLTCHVQGWNLPADNKKNQCLLWTRWWQDIKKKKKVQGFNGSLRFRKMIIMDQGWKTHTAISRGQWVLFQISNRAMGKLLTLNRKSGHLHLCYHLEIRNLVLQFTTSGKLLKSQPSRIKWSSKSSSTCQAYTPLSTEIFP